MGQMHRGIYKIGLLVEYDRHAVNSVEYTR